MIRKAQAIWRGDLKQGAGKITTDSKALNQIAYSFKDRFEDGPATNPEELIAAAHAGCFSMAYSLFLGEKNITADSIDTTAAVTMVPVDGAPTVTSIALTCSVTAPGASEAEVRQAGETAKANCPISRLLSNVDITLELTVTV